MRAICPSEKPARWECFHCEFKTSDEAEAEAHFGDRDDPEECKPICKWWQRMGVDERLEQFQDVIQQLNYERMENFNLDKQIGPLRSRIADLEAKVEALTAENGILCVQLFDVSRFRE
jgi:hypothetical protein